MDKKRSFSQEELCEYIEMLTRKKFFGKVYMSWESGKVTLISELKNMVAGFKPVDTDIPLISGIGHGKSSLDF